MTRVDTGVNDRYTDSSAIQRIGRGSAKQVGLCLHANCVGAGCGGDMAERADLLVGRDVLNQSALSKCLDCADRMSA